MTDRDPSAFIAQWAAAELRGDVAALSEYLTDDFTAADDHNIEIRLGGAR